MTVRPIYVDCLRDGDLIASHEYGWVSGALPSPAPDQQSLIDQSKTQLTNDRLAFPPYQGVTFRVRYP